MGNQEKNRKNGKKDKNEALTPSIITNGNGNGHQDLRGKSKGSQKHWIQPGTSGNPNGRPKGTKGFTNKLREVLDGDGFLVLEVEILDKENRPTGEFVRGRAQIPKLDAVVYAAIKKAVGGNMKAIEFVGNKYDGTHNTMNLNFGLLKDTEQRQRIANELRAAANG